MTDIPDILKHVMDSSSQLSAWALTIGGGSVAVIVSTSYRRPESLYLRLPYLLFLPGWGCIGYSLYLGNQLVGKYLASIMVRQEQMVVIASQVNDIYADQRRFLFLSLFFFGFWLIFFLVTWVYTDLFHSGGKK